MKEDLVELLACPVSGAELRLVEAEYRGDEVVSGRLVSRAGGVEYPIVAGVPRFVPGESYAASFGHQWHKYARLQLDSCNGSSFSRDRFLAITEWGLDRLRGKRVLDVGCGSGRFAEIALAAGASVVATDLSGAIDACRENLGSFRELECVQCSLYDLPFRDDVFDYVYCIGVIQHTPDPRSAVHSLTRKLAPGGAIGLWIYELDWKCFVGTLAFKYCLRPITRRMTIASLERLVALMERLCWPVTSRARHWGTLGRIAMRLLPVSSAHLQEVALSDDDFRSWVRLDTFDMYSPAHDHPQRYSRVAAWLAEAGLEVDARHPHGGISITACKPTSAPSVSVDDASSQPVRAQQR